MSTLSLINALYVATGLGMANGEYAFFTTSRSTSAYFGLGSGIIQDDDVLEDFYEAAQYLKLVHGYDNNLINAIILIKFISHLFSKLLIYLPAFILRYVSTCI